MRAGQQPARTATSSNPGGGPGADLNELTGWSRERVEVACLEVRQPSLEDVYLEPAHPAPERRARDRGGAGGSPVPVRPEDLLAQSTMPELCCDARASSCRSLHWPGTRRVGSSLFIAGVKPRSPGSEFPLPRPGDDEHFGHDHCLRERAVGGRTGAGYPGLVLVSGRRRAYVLPLLRSGAPG